MRDKAVESHLCAQNAQAWGTRSRTGPNSDFPRNDGVALKGLKPACLLALIGTAEQLAEKWDVVLVPSFRELFFRALSRPDFVCSGPFFDR